MFAAPTSTFFEDSPARHFQIHATDDGKPPSKLSKTAPAPAPLNGEQSASSAPSYFLPRSSTDYLTNKPFWSPADGSSLLEKSSFELDPQQFSITSNAKAVVSNENIDEDEYDDGMTTTVDDFAKDVDDMDFVDNTLQEMSPVNLSKAPLVTTHPYRNNMELDAAIDFPLNDEFLAASPHGSSQDFGTPRSSIFYTTALDAFPVFSQLFTSLDGAEVVDQDELRTRYICLLTTQNWYSLACSIVPPSN